MTTKLIEFLGHSTFDALYKAQNWLTENGYSYGRQERGAPTGIKRGDCIISKWRNLSAADRAAMDGVMEGDFRNGPVMIRIKAEP